LINDTGARIALPASATKRGYAFEYLILSYYNRITAIEVEDWSSCIYGKSGKLYQCDGILYDGHKRYLLEAKFFENRPASIRDVHPERREKAAIDIACDSIICVSLNGFDESVYEWKRKSQLEIILLRWSDIRVDLLSKISGFSTVLLDNFQISEQKAVSDSGSTLYFEHPPEVKPFSKFPEFVSFPDRVEIWLRRLLKLADYQGQLKAGRFVYFDAKKTVEFVAGRESDLSLLEAWEIEDTFSGYSARVYNALKATAQVLSRHNNSSEKGLQTPLQVLGWKTGETGIRRSLDNLVLLGFASKVRTDGRRKYILTPLGHAFANGGRKSDEIFVEQLRKWLPYRFMKDAISSGKVMPKRDDIIKYFKCQYRPYEPYAKCLFNDNTTDGLLVLFNQFG